MDCYHPVIVTHQVNKAIKVNPLDPVTRQLDLNLVNVAQTLHICYRKCHVITHTNFQGIIFCTFVPFTALLGFTQRNRLHAPTDLVDQWPSTLFSGSP